MIMIMIMKLYFLFNAVSTTNTSEWSRINLVRCRRMTESSAEDAVVALTIFDGSLNRKKAGVDGSPRTFSILGFRDHVCPGKPVSQWDHHVDSTTQSGAMAEKSCPNESQVTESHDITFSLTRSRCPDGG